MAYKYPNLAAEMARCDVDYGKVYKDVADKTGRSEDTVSNWITGRAGELTVEAAFAIKDEFFPGMSIEYLFSTTPAIGEYASKSD